MTSVPVPERVTVAERRLEVLRRRSAGQTFEQIAADLAPATPTGKYTSRHANSDYKRALEDAQKDLAEFAKLHLALELIRLDEYRRYTEDVRLKADQDGDGLQVLRAVDRLVTIGKRRDELLGLTRVTIEATKATESGGERPRAEDGVDEIARKRAARRIAAAK